MFTVATCIHTPPSGGRDGEGRGIRAHTHKHTHPPTHTHTHTHRYTHTHTHTHTHTQAKCIDVPVSLQGALRLHRRGLCRVVRSLQPVCGDVSRTRYVRLRTHAVPPEQRWRLFLRGGPVLAVILRGKWVRSFSSNLPCGGVPRTQKLEDAKA